MKNKKYDPCVGLFENPFSVFSKKENKKTKTKTKTEEEMEYLKRCSIEMKKALALNEKQRC